MGGWRPGGGFAPGVIKEYLFMISGGVGEGDKKIDALFFESMKDTHLRDNEFL
jgi:hypothetical protein